jgi:hypothetical protein
VALQSIDQITRDINRYPTGVDGLYLAKMMHPVPNTDIIDKKNFVLNKCIDRTVFDIGCGVMFHQFIQDIAKKTYGIDKIVCPKVKNFIQMDIETNDIPFYEDVDLILVLDVMEHLLNAGLFLNKLSKYKCEKIITLPNAFSEGHFWHSRKGLENVNIDHVCFYSYTTFKTLLTKCGYRIMEFYWYDYPEQIQHHGMNEGMVFVTL